MTHGYAGQHLRLHVDSGVGHASPQAGGEKSAALAGESCELRVVAAATHEVHLRAFGKWARSGVAELADSVGVREVCEAVNSSIHPVQNGGLVRHFRPELSGPEVRQVRADWIASKLLKLESGLWLNTGFASGSSFSLADIFVAAIFHKGLSLGINPRQIPRFAVHWSFLMAFPEIRTSCPIAGPWPHPNRA